MKKLALLVMPIMAVSILTNCGGDNEYKVTCTSGDVTLSNDVAKRGEDFNTTIKVKEDKIKEYYSVPSRLTKVTSGSKEVTNYTYTTSDATYSATLLIPKESIKGNIKIDLEISKLTSLCFTALEDSEVGYTHDYDFSNQVNIQKSFNDIDWEDWDGTSISLNKGEKMYVRNTGDELSSYTYLYYFFMSGKIAASGNAMSMINYADISNYCFYGMFNECEVLTSAPALPASSLKESCYEEMFCGCTSLVTSPELPATTLAESCYSDMFRSCSSLITITELPATELKRSCYSSMFRDCTSLTAAPYLPASKLVDECYSAMFDGDDNLHVTDTQKEGCVKIFTCPSGGANCCKKMFTTPGYVNDGKTYYYIPH